MKLSNFWLIFNIFALHPSSISKYVSTLRKITKNHNHSSRCLAAMSLLRQLFTYFQLVSWLLKLQLTLLYFLTKLIFFPKVFVCFLFLSVSLEKYKNELLFILCQRNSLLCQLMHFETILLLLRHRKNSPLQKYWRLNSVYVQTCMPRVVLIWYWFRYLRCWFCSSRNQI